MRHAMVARMRDVAVGFAAGDRCAAMNTTEEKAAVVRRGSPRLPTLRRVYSGDEVRLPPTVLRPSRGATSIGRDTTNGIALPDDPRSSRHHATLHAGVTGMLRVVDENSR